MGTDYCDRNGLSTPNIAEAMAGPFTVPDMQFTTLAQRLTWARKRARMSQTALAEAVGVSQTMISQLESGERKSSTAIASLANLLHVPALWLERGVGTPDPPSSNLETGAKHSNEVNVERLAVALDAVETWLLESGGTLSTSDKARAVALLYSMLPEALEEGRQVAKQRVVSLLNVARKANVDQQRGEGSAGVVAPRDRQEGESRKRRAEG
jgi:transcriptional regulator with XRE-family HTH domain